MSPCLLHKFHRPLALTSEEHHIEPQAWQKFAVGRIDKPETVTLCPTSHRNVHHFIVLMMKWIRATEIDSEKAAWDSMSINTKESRIARQALVRYESRGKSLLALARTGNLGQA